MENNEQLLNLISQIKHISLNHTDLVNVSLEYSNTYFDDPEEEAKFDLYWKDPIFIEQVTNSAREAIVLAMQAITLDEKIPFQTIVKECVNLEFQRHTEKSLTSNQEKIISIKKFLCYLRKELFSRIYSQNKDLQKVSKIPKSVLSSRYDYFMAQSF